MPYEIENETLQGRGVLVLSGGGHRMRVAPGCGANWFSWIYEGTELFAPWDLGWAGTKYGVPVLFPTPNRVRAGEFLCRGRTYRQVKNGQPRLIHGLVYDEAFEVTGTGSDGGSCFAEMEVRLTGGDLLASFPFPCGLRIRYSLDAEGPKLIYRVVNLGCEDVPYGFALHPYFAKMDPPEDTYIRVPAPFVHEAGEDKIPTGRVFPVAGTRYDLRESRSIADAALDHVYLGMAEGLRAQLEWRASGLCVTLEASSDFDHMVVYTPPDRPCVCLENQTCSTDAHNRHALGDADTAHLIVLEPGGSREGWVRFKAERLRG